MLQTWQLKVYAEPGLSMPGGMYSCWLLGLPVMLERLFSPVKEDMLHR